MDPHARIIHQRPPCCSAGLAPAAAKSALPPELFTDLARRWCTGMLSSLPYPDLLPRSSTPPLLCGVSGIAALSPSPEVSFAASCV